MGTMSINVLERTREIGVLRAIGASNAGVVQVFILEGTAIGLFSWLLGGVLALPLTRLIGNAIGLLILGTPLTYTFSTGGWLLWLALVVVLSAVASFLPARRAARLTVREVLAYE
jgi:putative ABC transport system permease protein